MPGNRRDPAWVGKIYILAVFGTFVGERAPKSFQVPNQLPSLHLNLDLLDYYFILREFGEVDGLVDSAHRVDKFLASFFQSDSLCQCTGDIIHPTHHLPSWTKLA